MKCDGRAEWNEITCVIGLILVRSHSVNRPSSGSRASSDIVGGDKSPLPIQNDRIGIASGNAETNIEECLGGKIGTRDSGGVRRPSDNTSPVESEVCNY